ncbi:encapsidation protein [Bacillus phage B103]|uniref:DNA packaging protein n=1 Tax=Bacillus phage B103 TaxID=2994042 RepID=PKG16_BPB03|nr:terminase [Bacillus phage B103]Q37897.1 RecName: Full=DNA packaging protein; AltName: Full=ATPase gp16; AltName: Full=Gene product 16; Short=gp16; AltName: Full=Protein p16 [Bacillus phage B103]CAA67647.1 encapsidation protein [Bacillus phage B103]
MLSYDRILNFVIGARGIGKSYAMKKHPIKRFIKHGEQFIYVRRYKPELKKIGNYFNDIAQEFPNHEFKVKGRQFCIDGKLTGWAIPLSAWQSEKSNAYPMVTTIIFDEFIRERDNSGYIPNEVDALLNLMDTVFRTRENGRCICLSNAVSIINPYFVYFGLVPDINKRFNAYKHILIEIPDSKDFSDERRKTKFGQLIDGTEYGEMSLDNEFVNDSDVFIEKRSKNSKFVFSIVYKGMRMGVWVDTQQMLLYLTTDHDPSTKNVYALTADDLEEGMILVSNYKKNYHIRKLCSAFMNGQLRFDNQLMRTIGYEMFKKMRVQ